MASCRLLRTLETQLVLINATRNLCSSSKTPSKHISILPRISRYSSALSKFDNNVITSCQNYCTAANTTASQKTSKKQLDKSNSHESSLQAQEDDLFKQIDIEVKGSDLAVIKSYEFFTCMAAKELGVTISRVYTPPRVITRLSLLKSVFVHKKHFHQYEVRTNYKVFEVKHITGSTANTFLEYIQRNIPEGLAMKVTKHQLHRLPEHLRPPQPPQQDVAAHDGDIDVSKETDNTQQALPSDSTNGPSNDFITENNIESSSKSAGINNSSIKVEAQDSKSILEQSNSERNVQINKSEDSLDHSDSSDSDSSSSDSSSDSDSSSPPQTKK